MQHDSGENRNQKRPPRLLLAEDEEGIRKPLAWKLRELGHEVVEARTRLDLLHHLSAYFFRGKRKKHDLVICDFRLLDPDELELIDDLHQNEKFPPICIITCEEHEADELARYLGIEKVFTVPQEVDNLVSEVGKLLLAKKASGKMV